MSKDLLFDLYADMVKMHGQSMDNTGGGLWCDTAMGRHAGHYWQGVHGYAPYDKQMWTDVKGAFDHFWAQYMSNVVVVP